MSEKNRLFLALGYICATVGILFSIFPLIPSITNYPFTVAWSEGGRIFSAFQVYAPIIAGKYLSLPWLDPGRSILDGLILLVPNAPIWAYRLWISILFIIINFLAALFTVRKAFSFSKTPDKQKKELMILLTLWGTLFLLQGPIYYHVLAGLLPVLWFYDEKRPVRNLITVIICSMWQGLCRVNWFLMPAAVAVLLYVLRTPLKSGKLLNYIKQPLILYVSGGISSFAVYWIYIKATGNESVFLNPEMQYGFFRYKLWPNTGFLGLIPEIALISFPVLLILLYMTWKYRCNLHWIRYVIILCIIGVFFVGSTVVSLRAGGGYDLHNYDTYLLLLFISGCFFGMDSLYLDNVSQLEKPLLTKNGILSSLLIIPTLMAFPKTGLRVTQVHPQSEQPIQEIREVLQNNAGSDTNHPILFIDQRQLLVFHIVEDDNIYVPYEKIELMEMAMANNLDYRSQFVSDVENHKFSLIVSEILGNWPKQFPPDLFERDWYENNVWVNFVSIPVLDNYKPIYTNTEIGLAIYAPKK
jgi:hypothetical protein